MITPDVSLRINGKKEKQHRENRYENGKEAIVMVQERGDSCFSQRVAVKY